MVENHRPSPLPSSIPRQLWKHMLAVAAEHLQPVLDVLPLVDVARLPIGSSVGALVAHPKEGFLQAALGQLL